MITFKCKGLIDGLGDVKERAIVAVKNGRFIDICTWDAISKFGPDVHLVDYSNFFIIPGLIDSHVHLIYTGREKDWEETNLPNEMLLLQAVAHSELALKSGVTTVADCGSKDNLAFYVREATKAGVLKGARTFACGKPITITGGHVYYLSYEADTPWETRKAARKIIKEGADFIKIMVTGGSRVPKILGEGMVNWNQYPAYGVEEIKPVVEEGHRLERKVIAHCLSAEGILNAVSAGTDVIAHAAFLQSDEKSHFDEAIATLMLKKGTYVVPTLSVFYHNVAKLEQLSNPTDDEKEEIEAYYSRLDTFNKLLKMGIKIAVGTDAGFSGIYHGEISLELQLMVRGGMTPLQAITAATKSSADSLGIGHLLGTIEKEKEADFLVLRSNPSEDIKALEKIKAVYQKGDLVVSLLD
jgi:imidazolonepropionase-like amidohydrolase